MRGKLEYKKQSAIQSRITPADAGKTLLPTGRRNAGQDHPRGCGENSHIGFWGMLGKGSPPRMRGKRSVVFFRIINIGITPADAGKTNGALLSESTT